MNKIFTLCLSVAVAALLVADVQASNKKRKGASILELAFSEDNQSEVDDALKELGDLDETPESAPAPAAESAPEPAPAVKETVKEVVVEKPVEVVKTVVVTNVIEKIVEVEKPVVVTNTVERVVERKIEDQEMRDKIDFQEAVNTDLAERNERLEQALAIEKERRERLERVVPKNLQPKTGRPAKITSANTFYDRKEGVAMFDRTVHVDDESYQLWADKAYVFLSGTNDVKRIVAIGNVAITNEARRAYGTKASYYKDGGMVVLYGDRNRPAEVRDESKADDQTVKGTKIKFWIDSEQVQVIDADIEAPTQGGGSDLKKYINR
ncbi:MAG: hypothetical protein IKP97_04475 [Kiritimatiellae bacterium]|nr:hypothetical protein [Kiritimatiellia bacterium]